MKKREAVSAMQ
jgi:nitrate reductase NapE component